MKCFTQVLIILTVTFFSCNQQAKKVDGNNLSNNSSSDELIGGYSFDKNGRAEMFIRKIGNNYYLQFQGDKVSQEEKLTAASPEICSLILGNNWQSELIVGLELGAFRVLKVKKGTSFEGKMINSGYIGGVAGAGEIWKVE